MSKHQPATFWDTLPFIAPAASQQTASAYGRIYAFGDSLSDAGNDFKADGRTLPNPFVYSDGRFSNGPVWVQDLAHDLHLPAVTPSLSGGTDFAFGGAETGAETLHGATLLDLPAQLYEFGAADPHPSANALFTLSIGGNDVIDATNAYASDPAGAVADVQHAVSNEASFIQGLAEDGAKNFVILNVPDIGKTPEEAANARAASYLSSLYNEELSGTLTSLGLADHLSIHLIDAFALIDNAVAHPAQYGYTNVTTPVWTGDFINPFSGTLNAYSASAQNHYLFFDHLHPTETGHEGLAALALASLK